MTSIYLMANSFDRFHSELVICHEMAAKCATCCYPVRDEEKEVDYFWDKQYGLPERSLQANNVVFWGEFAMLVKPNVAELVAALSLPLVFLEARCLSSAEVRNRFNLETDDFHIPLCWMRASCSIDVDSIDVPVCKECGKFSNTAWQLNRLKVRRKDGKIPAVFRVNQNRGEPTFVTEEAKIILEGANLLGVNFFKAGSIID